MKVQLMSLASVGVNYPMKTSNDRDEIYMQ